MNYKLFSLVSGTLILSSLSASGQKNMVVAVPTNVVNTLLNSCSFIGIS